MIGETRFWIENGFRRIVRNVRCSMVERRVYVKVVEITGYYTEQTLPLYPSIQQA